MRCIPSDFNVRFLDSDLIVLAWGAQYWQVLRQVHRLQTVVDQHLFFGDPLFDEFDNFDGLSFNLNVFHIKVLDGVIDSAYLDLEQFLNYLLLIMLDHCYHFVTTLQPFRFFFVD